MKIEGWLNKEEKITDAIINNMTMIYLGAITVLGLYIRFLLKDHVSADMTTFLRPWMQTLMENGGLAALKMEIGDYNPPYLIILALMSYIPMNDVLLIKIPSVLFDLFLAISTAVFVWKYFGDKSKAVFLYTILLLNPLIIINSAYWGQCDVIYASFLILCILFCMQEKYFGAFLLFGISFAFKQQALFILPVLVVLYVQKKQISLLHFLLIPFMNFLLCLPAIIAGRPIGNIMSIYFSQMGKYKYMTLKYYNIWFYFPGNYDEFSPVAIAFTLALIGTGAYWVLKKQIALKGHKLLYFSIWVVYSCCMFLPEMHERYGFALELLLVIYVVLYRRRIAICVTVCLITLAAYRHYFMGNPPFSEELLSVVNLACYLKLSYDGLQYSLKNEIPIRYGVKGK
ncbi:MAG: hypothetical protein J1E65_08985 [Lachnospiraceae bacterium]|nr:hypothetical protein [Lachnospiraceae bacterium]